MRWVERIGAGYERSIERARKRFPTFNHVLLATDRFGDVLGGRLAAAISYYGFFAAFSLVVLVFSILRRVPEAGGVVTTANEYVDQTLPFLKSTAQSGSGSLGILSAVTLVLTGVGWVEALRSSQRAVWGLDQHPGHWVVRRLVDLGMLVGLGLLLGLSLVTTTFIGRLLDWMAGPQTPLLGQVVPDLSGPVLEFAVNIVLAGALLAAVPRLKLSPRRLIPPTVVVAIGIQLLNSLGRTYIAGLSHNIAYQLVVGAVGLLVYLYLFNQLILFGAALAATMTSGNAADLANSNARITLVAEGTAREGPASEGTARAGTSEGTATEGIPTGRMVAEGSGDRRGSGGAAGTA